MSVDARISTTFPSHHKTKKLKRLLGVEGCWSFLCLLLWVRANRPDGSLAGMTAEDIELAIDWGGAPDAFVQALGAVGYLDGGPGNYVVHDWDDHNPWSTGSDRRSLRAKWNAVKRHHGEAEADRLVPDYRRKDAASNATSTGKDAGSNVVALLGARTSNAPSPSPSPSPEARAIPADAGTSPIAGEPAPGDAPDDDDGKAPRCPIAKIVATYHRKLPMLPPVNELPEQTANMIRKRWRSHPDRQTLDWWEGYFAYVARCPFLVGEKTDFQADLLWLVRPTNFAKVLNGNYEERRAS